MSDRINYRERLELHIHQAFPLNSFMQYVKTLSNYDKLMLAITLKLPFSRKDLKQWPDLLFYKKLNLLLKKIATDRKLKKQLLLFLIDRILLESPSLEDYQSQLQQLVDEHGYWCIFWSLYFHPERADDEALYEQIRTELEQLKTEHPTELERQSIAQSEVAATSEVIEVQAISDNKLDQHRLDKKIAILEDKISKESATRQQLELAGVQKDKVIRQLQQEQEKLQQQANLLKEQIAMYEMKVSNLKRAEQEMNQRRRDDEERWLNERASLLGQNKQNWDEIRKLSNQLEQLQRELEDSKRQSNNWQQLAQQRQEELHSLLNSKPPLDQQLGSLLEQLHLELDQSNNELMKLMKDSNASYEQRQYYRQQMRNALELVEVIDKFQQEKTSNVSSPPSAINQEEKPIAVEQLLSQDELKVITNKQQAPQANQRYGTFYRRDHGGYIELEGSEIFNITESLVQQLELQHEAEVLCTPTAHPGRANHYTIELLFQGDDSYSPIQTFDGFVHLDEDQKWYCIDINDDSNRFPIHFKDIEIQKPGHGDPCTFNVAEDGHIARLTKLYRLPGDMLEAQHPARKKNEAARPKVNQRRKIEPFLQDCMITIIGGQRKWFEAVVKETGAELVHDGGEHPERIASDLSRSQALFMILTSTSHRATWEGIEIAKGNSIPHFVIQGSKSNLRKLLWENQEVIRSTNRVVEA